MRELLIGIDSGTQSTKALVVDANTGKVLGSGSGKHDLIPGLAPGAKEQHPGNWRKATSSAIKAALKQAKAKAGEVKAIGVSGQQHGFVPLDKAGNVIRPAKLWCDTATSAECEEITAKLGGLKKTIGALGNAVLPGFTASKILWLKKHEPKNFAKLATVLLPHDYLNFWLTGALPGDGTLTIGLAAVIEDHTGEQSFWALAHRAEKPDFHSAAGFVLQLERDSTW